MKTETYLNLFITAWEDGSTYWAYVDENADAESTFNKIMNEGYVLKVYDVESDDVWTLQKSDIIGSLKKFKEQFPNHYLNLCNDTWDAETADVWFQLVVIGEYTFA